MKYGVLAVKSYNNNNDYNFVLALTENITKQ